LINRRRTRAFAIAFKKLLKNRRERRQFVVARAAETAVYGSIHEDFEHRTAA